MYGSNSPRAIAKSAVVKAAAVYDFRLEMLRIQQAYAAEAHAKNIELTLVLGDEIPVAYWDMDSLRNNVLNTLLASAIHATPTGGKVMLSVHKFDNYNMIIRISDAAPAISSIGAASDDTQQSEAVLCVLAHQGTIKRVKNDEQCGAVVEIMLPLYVLCMQGNGNF